MCNCREELETQFTESFKKLQPDAVNHNVSLGDMYQIFITKKSMDIIERPVAKIIATADFPMKKGGYKSKRITDLIKFKFCPFCGVEISL
jgi:hypothetical protein